MTRSSRSQLDKRLSYAMHEARAGKTVVIIAPVLADVPGMLENIARRPLHPGEHVIRVNGRQGFETTAGSITFRVASHPDGLRGLHQVDLIMVDPDVVSTTELEDNMRLATLYAAKPWDSGTIHRQGDQP